MKTKKLMVAAATVAALFAGSMSMHASCCETEKACPFAAGEKGKDEGKNAGACPASGQKGDAACKGGEKCEKGEKK